MKLTTQEHKKLWCHLSRSRVLNDIFIELKQKQQMHAPLLLGYGNEIIPLCVKIALERNGIEDESYFQISHRDQAWYVAHNHAPNTRSEDDLEWLLLLNHLTKASSPTKGRDANIHGGSLRHHIIPFGVSHMGAYVPVAVGVALGLFLKKWIHALPGQRPVVLSSFGDGAFQQGCIHEAFNMAATLNAKLNAEEWREFEKFAEGITRETSTPHGAPIIFIVNDNGYSLSANDRESYGRAQLSLRALGYNMTGVEVDSHDPQALVEVIEESIERAQRLQSSLIIVTTDRLMGHNQTESIHYMDRRRLLNGWKNDLIGGYRYMNEKLEHEYKRGEFRMGSVPQSLIDAGILTKEDVIAEHEKNTRELEILVEHALNEPDPVAADNEHSFLFKPHTYSIPAVGTGGVVKRMSYLEAVRHVLGTALKNDSDVVVFGEDYASPKGDVFGLTRGLSTKYGNDRVWNTPISEEAILGLAHGLSFVGLKPFAGIQFAPFISSAGTELLYVIPTSYNHMSIPVGITVLVPFGFGEGSGNEHADVNEALAYNRLGWKIAFPANAYDAAGLLWAAKDDPNPVLLYLQIVAFSLPVFSREVPLEPFCIPFGKADIKKRSSIGNSSCTSVSVITYGAACVEAALNVARDMEAKESVSIEVVDLCTIVPLDWETVFDSVKRNHRAIIFHEAYKQGSVSSDIAARIWEECYGSLYGPIQRVCAKDMPRPSAKNLEIDCLPWGFGDGKRIISPRLEEAIRFLIQFGGS